MPDSNLFPDNETRWFVMRDLTRPNAKLPAYKMLEKEEVECYTPLVRKLVTRNGKRTREEVPFMQDLLFVHDTRLVIDPIVEKVRTFQYRYLKGRVPMTVRDADMERFRSAVEASEFPQYYKPEEVTPAMRERRIAIVGGPLDGHEGTLVTVRGSKFKRLLVEIPGLLAASVEVTPEYIRLL